MGRHELGCRQGKLKIIIDNEDRLEPLNDDQIVEKLAEQGLTLARRTVAKYRKSSHSDGAAAEGF